MPYTYILKFSDSSFYTGSTWNLEKRLHEHNEGIGARYTAKRLPVELVYFEEYDRITDAFNREKHIQRWSHAKKEALILNNWGNLHKLSECKNETHCKNYKK